MKQKMRIGGNIVILGFGTIGKGILPMILKHVDISKSKIFVVEAKEATRGLADKYEVNFLHKTLDPSNYREVVGSLLSDDSFLVNCTNDVSSCDLVQLSHEKQAFYIDSCIEPWLGVYGDMNQPLANRTNYMLREQMLKLKRKLKNGPTAMVAVGANPGLVSFLVKEALLKIGKDTGHQFDKPKTKEEWANLAYELDIHGIHIAERDHQVQAAGKKQGVFYNTWSVDGFMNEGTQPAELGWGTKETWFPPNGHQHSTGPKCAIFLDSPGMLNRVRSWTPLEGSYLGYLITHNESISLADYLTHRKEGKVVYRPTAFYAYYPSNDTMLSIQEFVGRNMNPQKEHVVLNNEITDGVDELGVLLYGHKKNALWMGSHLSIHDARKRMTDQNATALQVTSTIMGSMMWAVKNPRKGIVEAEDMDHEEILGFATPYIAPIVARYTDWSPIKDVNPFMIRDLDAKLPWSFKNLLLRSK